MSRASSGWRESCAGPFASVGSSLTIASFETVATRIAELAPVSAGPVFAIDGDYLNFAQAGVFDGQARQEQALANQVREDLRWLGRGRRLGRSRRAASMPRMVRMAELACPRAQRLRPCRGHRLGSHRRMTQKLVVARAITKSPGQSRSLPTSISCSRPATSWGCSGPTARANRRSSACSRAKSSPIRPRPKARWPKLSGPSIFRRACCPPGTIRRADRLRTVVFSQHRTEIDPSITLAEALSPHADAVIYRAHHCTSTPWARKFLFTSQQLKQPVRSLSGGEQGGFTCAAHAGRRMCLCSTNPPTTWISPRSKCSKRAWKSFPGVDPGHARSRMLARLSTHIIAPDGEAGHATLSITNSGSVHELARASRKVDRAVPSGGAAAGCFAARHAAAGNAEEEAQLQEQRELADIPSRRSTRPKLPPPRWKSR